MTARDIMTTGTPALAPDTSIEEAARRFRETGLVALPIIDTTGRLQGAVSIRGLLLHALPSYLASQNLQDVRFAPDLLQLHERLVALRRKPVSTVMDQTPLTVRPDHSVLECAALLLHAPSLATLLLVVEESGRLVGVVTPWDLIKEIG